MLPDTLTGRFDELLDRLTHAAASAGRKLPRRGHGYSYTCCCPAHDDKSPSLSVTLEGGKILLHCFAGCETREIADAVGLPVAAMFDDYKGEPATYPRLGWNGQSQNAASAIVSQLDERPMPMPPPIGEFLSLEMPKVEPLLGPFCSQQLALIHAPPGVGKTMFVLQLAWCIAMAQEFIGWAPSRAAKVLMVDGEMAGQRMQGRLSGAAAAGPNLHIANLANWASSAGYEPINVATAAGQDVINVWANACGAEVIILDNLMSLAWVDGVSMNSDEFWAPVRRFAVQQRAQGRLVIVVDHSNQSGQIHGTKTKLWHADIALSLHAMDDEEPPEGFEKVLPSRRFRVHFEKVRESASEMGQSTFERVVTMGAVGQPWGYEKGRDQQRRMAREMHGNGLSIRDIAEELKVSKSAIGRWVK